MYESGLDSRGRAVGKRHGRFQVTKINIRAFRKMRGVQQQHSRRHIDSVVAGGSDEILILSSISCGRKRDVPGGVHGRNVDVARDYAIPHFFLLLFRRRAAGSSGTDIYFAIAADKYS